MSTQNAAANRILLVDDNPSIHEDYRKILAPRAAKTSLDSARSALFGGETPDTPTRAAYAVDSAMQGAEAINCVRKAIAAGAPYCVAFVDMRMPPGIDGVETIRRMWEIDADLQVVICTAYSDYTRTQIVEALGETDQLLILKKPFDAVEVAQLACALTAKWHATREARMKQDDLERAVTERTKELYLANRRLKAEIDRRNQAEDRLAHGAMHDNLTDLPNRSLLLDRIGRCLERAKRKDDYKIAVLLIDLDEFKVINDSLGHKIGDELLVAASQRLSTSLRTIDTVARGDTDGDDDTTARLGGDEFVILLDDIRKIDDAELVAERIKAQMSQPFEINGHEIVTTVSIGIATCQDGDVRADELLRDADTALHRAKAGGKSRHVIFSHDMRVRAVERLELEAELRKAIERNELALYYQPIVSLATGRIEGFEALVRWIHPQRGLVPPDEFIPIAEETDLIIPLGRWVFAEAARQLRTWRQRFVHCQNLTVSVNLSIKQFREAGLAKQIQQAVDAQGVPPRQLKLEITESMLMQQGDRMNEMLSDLKQRGFDLHLDDFGTGYSSLTYLKRFPVEAIKIDRSFVAGLGIESEDSTIVEAVVRLGQSLGLNVVAEGIESPLQLARLRDLGCDRGQGYLFGRPRPAELIERERANV